MKFTIAAGVLFLLGMSMIILANFIVYMVIGEINARSAPEDQIGMFFVQSKMGQILERHRELFPNSPRRRQIYIVGLAGIALVFAAFFALVAPSFLAK